jgi:hypothetical protein
MATRKRARPTTDPVSEAPEQPATIDTLADFVGTSQPDRAKMAQALDLAREAAAAFTGRPVPEQMSHPLRQGVQLLASRLLLTGQLQGPVQPDDIPLVVRYYWRLAGAGR